jgi:mRNA interferase HicA
MKRSALIRHVQEQGCELWREDSRHSLFWNPVNHQTSAIPRHVEIADKLARKICKDLGVPPVK